MRNNKSLGKKIIFFAVIICLSLLTYGGGKILLSNDAIVHGVANPVQEGDEAIDGTEFVTFDSFFLADTDEDGVSEGYRTNEIEVGKSEKLYFDIKVTGDTKLKNAKITFEKQNVKVSGTIGKGSLVENTLTSQDYDEIELKEVDNGLSSFFYLNVTPYVGEYISKYNGVNKVILTGTIENTVTHEEKDIRKEVNFNVNAYATKITSIITKTNDTESKPFAVTYNIEIKDTANQMPFLMNHMHGVISPLNGVKPKTVRIYSNSGKNVTVSYDENSGSFNASMNSSIENGQAKNPAYTTMEYDTRITNWHVYVEYPEEQATPGVADISIVTFSQGFGNGQYQTVMSTQQSAIFSHQFFPPVTTTEGFSDDSNQQLGVSKASDTFFVDKTKIMQSYDRQVTGEATFKEYWSLVSRLDPAEGGKVVYTGTDLLLNNNVISRYAPYTHVRHASNLFYNNGGRVSVYNEQTGGLLVVLDKSNSNEDIVLPDNVYRVKLVTSHMDKYENIYSNITFTRQFDIDGLTSAFSKDSLERYKDLKTYFTANQLYDDDSNGPAFAIKSNSLFDVSEAWARGNLDKDSYDRSVENTSIPMVYTITFSEVTVGTEPWKEGIAVVEFPEQIIDVQNLNITTDNDVLSKEVYQSDGKTYVKLHLKTSEQSLSSVALDFDAVIDSRSSDISDVFTLYAINKSDPFYRDDEEDTIDIDGDGDTSEIINVSRRSVNITAPREVITGSIIKNYDAANSETISPLIADVNPLRGSSDADMEIFVINNSDNVIKDVEFIGKVGYTGNTYVDTNVSMGTEYDTEMAGPIVVPDALQGHVEVYYSTNENPTRDLSVSANNWTQSPSDYSLIKTYMIKIDNTYNIAIGDNVYFRYPIELPETTTNLNKVSYYNHKVYFNYTTDAGTYSSSVSGAKLGIRLARKYDVNLNLYKIYSNSKLAEGTYLIEDNQGNSKTITIGPNGTGSATGLYVDRVYSIKQVSSGRENIIDGETKHFKITNGTSDNLLLSNDGTYRSISFDNESSTLNIDVENEVLYKLDLLNTDAISDSALRNSKFVVTGVNHENGTLVSTDSNGHAIVEGLLIGQTYEVEQRTVNGYAPVTNFELKIVRDPATHEIYVTAKRSPYFTIKNCDPIFNIEALDKEDDRQKYSIYTSPDVNEQTEVRKCTLGLDLTKFEGNYSIGGTLAYYVKSNSSRVWFRVASGTDVSSTGVVGNVTPYYSYSYFSTGSRSFNINQAWVDEGSGASSVSLTGGRNYDFEIEFDRNDIGVSEENNDQIKKNYYNTLSTVGIISADGEIIKTIVEQERVNVSVGNTDTVKETLTHYDLQDSANPVLTVKVQNKAIETAEFEIVKIDSDSQEPLEGAQFKISGPGIKNGFTYLTTDSNGKASIDLYKSYSGNINAIPGLTDEGYPLVNMYEIKEISAPQGYSIDNKPIVFKLDYQVIDQNTFVKKLKVDKSLDHEFSGTQVDENEDLFKGFMEDYPSIKIVKKDAETQNLLPNTYFVIKKVNEDGSLTFAQDVNHNMVGSQMLVNNVTYFVVKTDEKGEIRLNLSSGKYQLEELIASDDKYDLTGQVYIFTVGESIPYEPQGANLEEVVSLGTSMGTNADDLTTLLTDDGGYLIYAYKATYDSNQNGYITKIYKYSSEDELEWSSEFIPKATRIERYLYFNDPDRYVDINTTEHMALPSSSNLNVYEGSDAFYVYYGHTIYYRISKADGTLLDEEKSYVEGQIYTQLCDKEDGETYEEKVLYAADDTKYYCGYTSTTYDNYPNSNGMYNFMSFDVNGTNAAMVYSIYSPSLYRIRLKDGSILNREFSDDAILIRFDKDGNIASATPLHKSVIDAINTYIDEAQIPISHISYTDSSYKMYNNGPKTKIKLLDDGSIVVYTQMSSGGWIIKIDKNDNVVSARPTTVNAYYYYADSTDSPLGRSIYIDDDGYVYMKGAGNGISYKPSDSYKNTIWDDKENYYDFEVGEDDGDTNGYYPLLKYNSNGKLIAAVEVRRARTSSEMDYSLDTNMWKINPVQVFDGGFTYAPVEDGFIVFGRASMYAPSDDATEDQLKLFYRLDLHNGTKLNLDFLRGKVDNYSYDGSVFMLAKYNYDSSVEWIRFYEGFGSNYNYNRSMYGVRNIIPVKDNVFYRLLTPASNGEVDEHVTNEHDTVQNKASDNDLAMYKFYLSDEVTPETPAQYKLEIFNYLKQYNINATSNEGGKFNVNNGDETIFDGANPGKVETVDHGKNSLYKIKVIPDAGYTIKSITVNGNQADYTVYDDGTVTLKKFNNVIEDKNINVEFELGSSKVIVHHYFKGTTDQAASDELLTGHINDPYVTEAKVNDRIELAKDENGEYIIPSNYKGDFAVTPIVVTYYYVNKPAVLETNYLYEDSTESIAPSDTETKVLGDTYETSPKEIPNYKVTRVAGKESGTLDIPLTKVNYYYDQITSSHLYVHYVDKDTNNDIATGYDEALTVGEDYTARALTEIPQYYTFDSDSGNTSGPANLERIDVYFYYVHDKSKITTKHIDAETGDKLAEDVIDYVNKGGNYTTSALTNLPEGYVLKQVPDNASGPADSDEINVVYYYETKKAKLITKYINAETGEKLKDDNVVVKLLGDTYETSGLNPIPDGFNLQSIDGKESGTLDKAETIVTYYYITNKVNLTVKYLDKRTNKALKEEDVFIIKLGDSYSTTGLNPIPSGYELVEEPANATGVANQKEIVVIYYYKNGSPKTNDGIIKYIVLSVASITVLAGLVVFKRIKKDK